MSDNTVKSKSFFMRFGGFAGALFLAFLAVLAFELGTYLSVVVFWLLGTDPDVYEGSITLIYALITIGVMYVYYKLVTIKRDRLVMNGKLPVGKALLLVAVAIGMVGLVTVFLMVVAVIAESLAPVQDALDNYTQSVDRYSDVESAVVPWWDAVIGFVASCIFIPILEELTFRGIILGELLRKFHPAAAISISAIIFGLLHGVSIQIVYALVCGIMLGCIYYLTSSLKASILVHAIFNLIGGGLPELFENPTFSPYADTVNSVMNVVTIAEFALAVPAVIGIVVLAKIRKEEQEKALAEKEAEQIAAETEV
ncbi:MAG: CPBP family intramembrane metalloprotease [Clostridiales bacterium]|nr:CPBP family intramembrane metalloprotease [Clostridiales bacterium]